MAKLNRTRRMVQLLTALQSGRQHTIDDLITLLGASKRTLFRDLKLLQEVGVKYHCDQRSRRYTADAGFTLPPLTLTTEEAFTLLLLVYKGRKHIDLPFRTAALIAGLKIENNLHPRIRNYCVGALRHITLQSYPRAAKNKLDTVFPQLQKAIMNRRTIDIRYYCPKEHKEIDMKLNPYHLLYGRYTWYLLGNSCSDSQIKAFKLSSIKQVRILDKNFIEEPSFSIRDYLGKAWSILPEGKLYNIKLRFTPEAADDIMSVRWHETQTSHFEDDGSAIVEFRVDGLDEIIWWILSYGDRVEVLTPLVLRQRITKIAQKIANPPQSAPVIP